MYTVNKNTENEIEIKKSKFISKIYKIYNLEEVREILQNLKKEYKDATHYCYAYIINENKKSSDDNEPSGTAGIPILQALEKNNLNYVLCVVIRYFGGIKLGAGGLVRAYTKSVTEGLKKSQIIELIEGYEVEISTSYEEQKRLDYILKEYKFTKNFNNNVIYKILIPKEEINKLNEFKPKIIKEIQIEKENFD